MDKQQIRAQFLGASSDAESLDQLRETYGHRLVVEFRDKCFRLCPCIGNVAQLEVNQSRIQDTLQTFPYILEGSMDAATGFVVTEIIEGPAM